MDEKPYEEIIGRELAFLSEAGFGYEYLYDKGSDSSCVYIYRLKKGRDFLDFRTLSGGEKGNFVVFSGSTKAANTSSTGFLIFISALTTGSSFNIAMYVSSFHLRIKCSCANWPDCRTVFKVNSSSKSNS